MQAENVKGHMNKQKFDQELPALLQNITGYLKANGYKVGPLSNAANGGTGPLFEVFSPTGEPVCCVEVVPEQPTSRYPGNTLPVEWAVRLRNYGPASLRRFLVPLGEGEWNVADEHVPLKNNVPLNADTFMRAFNHVCGLPSG
jgi:hypothetical protein